MPALGGRISESVISGDLDHASDVIIYPDANIQNFIVAETAFRDSFENGSLIYFPI